ncbi:MAG: hypothetical protein ACOYNL_10340 [Rickettsiales bacterium]
MTIFSTIDEAGLETDQVMADAALPYLALQNVLMRPWISGGHTRTFIVTESWEYTMLQTLPDMVEISSMPALVAAFSVTEERSYLLPASLAEEAVLAPLLARANAPITLFCRQG